MTAPNKNFKRIGVFVDGGYFAKASDLYFYHHWRRARLSVHGVFEFIRNRVAKEHGANACCCQIVDAHYFRGRFYAGACQAAGKLWATHALEEELMDEGVATHYLPVQRIAQTGRFGEKGIDVWLALEALELALLRRFEILVLIAGDGDYLPLVRKLKAHALPVMLLAWNYACQNEQGELIKGRVCHKLRETVAYPVDMHRLIDERNASDDPLIAGLFSEPTDSPEQGPRTPHATNHDKRPAPSAETGSESSAPLQTTSFGSVMPPPPPACAPTAAPHDNCR